MPIQSLSDSTFRPFSGKQRHQARSRAHCTDERSRSAKIKKRTPKNSWFIQLLFKVGSNFSKIIRPLVQNEAFPLLNNAISAFHLMKNKRTDATLQPTDEAVPFIVETDASDFTIAATLNQNGKPIAFHARILSTLEQRNSAVEKRQLIK